MTQSGVAFASVLSLCLSGAAGAQARPTGENAGPASTGQPPPSTRTVSGRVVRPGAAGFLPVAGAQVTLHRVGPDSAAPMDSVRTSASGGYRFAYRPWGSDQAVYFVSASYGGIAYFGEPLSDVAVSGEGGQITVFDTTTSPIPLTVRGRHLIVAAPGASGARTVTEVYELSNDSTLTAIAPRGGATFTAVLPEGAVDARAAGGDVAEEAVSFSRGRAAVAAPFSPGLRQLVLAYTLPATAFPLRVPVLSGAQVLEVLVEDPAAQVTGAGLAPVNAAPVSGRTFKRFLAQDVPASAVVSVALPEPPVMSRTRYLAVIGAVIGAAMLAALMRALLVRRRAPAVSEPAPERLVREIAALDEQFERHHAPDPQTRERYSARRAQLKAQLSAALAQHGD